MELVITEPFGDPVADCGGFTRSGLRYQIPPSLPLVVEEDGSVLDTRSLVDYLSLVGVPLIWEMNGAVKGPRRYSGAVGIIELDDFI